MTTDSELLRLYATTNAQTAFAEFVDRNLGIAYGAALRQVGGNSRAAEEIAHAVFALAAQKASKLADHPSLAGWIHQTARFVAKDQVRASRARHELPLMADPSLSDQPAVDWDRIRGTIDEVLEKLGEDDREVLILRYFASRGFAEIGAKLGVSEDAARKRTDRALDKLRTIFGHRGVTSTTAALASALSSYGGAVPPAGLAASVSATATAAAATVSGFSPLIFMQLYQKIGAALVMALGAGYLVITHQHEVRDLRQEIESLTARNAAILSDARKLAEARHENARLQQLLRESSGQSRPSAAPPASPQNQAGVPAQLTSAKSRANWQNLGQASPTEAYETLMWACDRGDLETLVNGFDLTAAQHTQAETVFHKLTEETRAKYGSPEKMMALLFASGTPESFEPVATKSTSADETTVRVRVFNDRGEKNEIELSFHRSPTGWRASIPDWQMNKSLARVR